MHSLPAMLMNVFFDNPIANLRGPQFLLFFAVVSAVAIVVGRLLTRAFDPTAKLPVPPVPPEIDPYEIAFLRGGHAEYVRLIILDLVQRKYLKHVEVKGVLGTATPKLDQSETAPYKTYLNKDERLVFDWMRGGKSVSEIMPALPKALESSEESEAIRKELEDRHLLANNEHRAAGARAARPLIWLILALSAYKIIVAVSRGRQNIWFLIGLTVVALIIFVAATRPVRLTALGRAYLERIQGALEQLKMRMPTLVTGGAADHVALAVAAFGLIVLDGTALAQYPTMFKRGADGSSGSGCGSSCGSGSSCSGGSSCGGGCGGGGCGGCGS